MKTRGKNIAEAAGTAVEHEMESEVADDTPLLLDGKACEMPRKNEDLKKQLRQIIRRHETIRKNQAALKKRNEQLLDQVKELSKNGKKLPVNTAMSAKCQENFVQYLFRKWQFVQDEDDKKRIMDELCEIVYEEEARAGHSEDYFGIWMNTYASIVVAKCNATRSYVQNRMKDGLAVFHKNHGFIPTVEEIIKCALRTIDVETKRGYLIFEYYWKDLMGTC